MRSVFSFCFICCLGTALCQSIPEVGERPDTLSLSNWQTIINEYEFTLEENDRNLFRLGNECDSKIKNSEIEKEECITEIKRIEMRQIELMGAMENALELMQEYVFK